MSVDLKPCPFCGPHGYLMVGGDGAKGTPPRVENGLVMEGTWERTPEFIRCINCGCKGPQHEEIAEAARLWNQRTQEN